jgi:hypothetical protein
MTAQIIAFPGSNRSHWTVEDERAFESLRSDGSSVADAAAYIERRIASRNIPDSGDARSLRQAREAFRELQTMAKR